MIIYWIERKNLTQIEDYLNKIETIGVTVLVKFYREWLKKLESKPVTN